jgi:prepilin-type N-terminal cleavage/methylation domain-containing protein
MTRRAGTRRDERGFSLIELFVVMLVIGIVANIALPNLVRARERARASAVVADFNTVRRAAIQYLLKGDRWPPDAGAGVEPAELAPLLERGIVWNHGSFDYEWENWMAPDGTPTHEGTGVLIGFSVRSNDPGFLEMVEQAWGSPLARRADGVTFAVVPITP